MQQPILGVIDTETTGLFPSSRGRGSSEDVFSMRLDPVAGSMVFETGEADESDAPRFHRIIEIGAVLCTQEGEIVGEFQTLVDPGFPIPSDATDVHGITDADVAGAPPIEVGLERLFDFLDGADMILAYNAPFDLRFIVHEFLLCGLMPPEIKLYDVMRLASRAGFGRPSLASLAEAVGLSPSCHRALDDAALTGRCLSRLLATSLSDVATLHALIDVHDSTTPVYDTVRCLQGTTCARLLMAYRHGDLAPPTPSTSGWPALSPADVERLAEGCDTGRSSAPARREGTGKTREHLPRLCVTGKLPGLLRKEVKPRIEAVGYSCTSEPTREGVEFLVVGERPTARKVEAAVQRGIVTMPAEDFLRWLNARECIDP